MEDVMAKKKADAETWPKILPGGTIYLGLVPDDDPIYRGGWNFLTGKNLKPKSSRPSETSSQAPTRK
jgi:hypothetical protein